MNVRMRQATTYGQGNGETYAPIRPKTSASPLNSPTTNLDLFAPPRAARAEARHHALGKAQAHREALLAAFRDHGPMTADEAGVRCGLGPLEARPRCTELRQAGQLRATGGFGRSALGNSASLLGAA